MDLVAVGVAMKYALWELADQTWCYFTEAGEWTTLHAEAALYDSVDAAEAARQRLDNPALVLLEFVFDEQEFRSREPTW